MGAVGGRRSLEGFRGPNAAPNIIAMLPSRICGSRRSARSLRFLAERFAEPFFLVISQHSRRRRPLLRRRASVFARKLRIATPISEVVRARARDARVHVHLDRPRAFISSWEVLSAIWVDCNCQLSIVNCRFRCSASAYPGGQYTCHSVLSCNCRLSIVDCRSRNERECKRIRSRLL